MRRRRMFLACLLVAISGCECDKVDVCCQTGTSAQFSSASFCKDKGVVIADEFCQLICCQLPDRNRVVASRAKCEEFGGVLDLKQTTDECQSPAGDASTSDAQSTDSTMTTGLDATGGNDATASGEDATIGMDAVAADAAGGSCACGDATLVPMNCTFSDASECSGWVSVVIESRGGNFTPAEEEAARVEQFPSGTTLCAFGNCCITIQCP